MRPLLLSLLSGLLLAFSLPPFDQGWLAWMAVAPLLVAVRGRRPLEAVGLGLLSGVVCGQVHDYVAVPFLILGTLLAVTGLFGSLARRRWEGLAWTLLVACAGVAAEWTTLVLPIPVQLALSQYRMVPVLQVAALAGAWGVSFLVWWTNAVLADAWLRQSVRTPAARALLGAAGVTALYSALVLLEPNVGRRPAPLPVATVQDLERGEEPELTRAAVARGAKLVVWSELCLGGSFDPGDPEEDPVRLARELGIYLVVGHSEPAQPKPYNTTSLIGPDGRILGRHRKMRPFLGERNGIQPGQDARAFDTALGPVGLEICFDSCYPAITRRIVRQGARLIAVPNYDPPSPGSILHHLHSTILPFRAVENGVPMLRADPTGFSQIVDARGRILSQSPLERQEASVARVRLGNGRGTLYTLLGDWLAYLCLGVVAGAVAAAARTRRKRTDE